MKPAGDNLCLCIGAPAGHIRNYEPATRERLAANLVRRNWINELDELEGLGLAVAAVDLT